MTKEKIVSSAIVIYIISGLILLIGKRSWFPDFYNPEFMGALAIISALLIILPRLVFKSENPVRKNAVLDLQTTLAISLLVNGAGGLGLYQLYQYGFEYDKLMHFIVPFLLTISGSRFISLWYNIEIEKALFISAVLIVLGSLAWEIFEFLSDWYIGTQTLGFYGKEITKDTIVDVIINAIGIIAGSIFILRKK